MAGNNARKEIQGTEGTITKAGKTATREVTDSWLTFKTKLAMGKAPSLATSVRASEVARRVPGVRAVRNELAS